MLFVQRAENTRVTIRW